MSDLRSIIDGVIASLLVLALVWMWRQGRQLIRTRAELRQAREQAETTKQQLIISQTQAAYLRDMSDRMIRVLDRLIRLDTSRPESVVELERLQAEARSVRNSVDIAMKSSLQAQELLGREWGE